MFRCVGVLLLSAVLAPSQSVRDWVRANEGRILDEFRQLLSIPNIASDTPNIRRNADLIVSMLEKRGVKARLLEVEGAPPAVFGDLPSPGATRTLAFYAHYDGQPVNPAEWRTGDPFKPVIQDSRIWGRSTADDKAPIIALVAALDALKASGTKPAVNIKFLFEGEEEAGSPHLDTLFAKYLPELKADLWLICDGPVHQSGRQQVYFGARGVTTMSVTVYGANRELHSGHYGGWAPNAAMMLAHLLASMRSPSGRVLIDGFYDGAVPLSDAEKRALAAAPPIDSAMREELGLQSTENSPRTLGEIINEPSLNIRGIRSADTGKQSRNVVPASATASIDIRLVKGISPRAAQDRLVEHIRKQGYYVVDREPDAATRKQHARIALVTRGEGYPAAKTPMNVAAAQQLIAAIEGVTKPVVQSPTLGGSVPLYMFEERLRTPFIGLPIANHDNNQHAANENLRLDNLWTGIEVFAAVMTAR